MELMVVVRCRGVRGGVGDGGCSVPFATDVARDLNVPSSLFLIQSTTSFSIYNRFCNRYDVNTLDGLEPDSMKSIRNSIVVGTLVSSTFSGNKSSCLEWLDSKKENSVVYVSFGSLAVLTKTQKVELLHGLMKTQRPFLLVLRDVGEDEDVEIKQLKEKSLVAGVAIVGCPQFSDQTTNAKMVDEVWGNGVRAVLDEEMMVRRDEIKRCLDAMMDGGERAKEIKKNTEKWRKVAEESVKDGGSLQTNLKLFLQNIS
nr:crocetin glucosyltransferase, chloroplastic-like [Tanacetum cinerariifolium]GEW26548.1 crocetin glucosyltransferase, chloroplastic-like [Tanacetum cinerariifolium]